MPIYCYECPECRSVLERLRPMSQSAYLTKCPWCAATMKRDIQAEALGSSGRDYDQPVISRSLGVGRAQVQEARRMFPNHEYRDDGALIVRSHAELKRVTKDLGMGGYDLAH